ncbi:hypothetical protein [Microcoleus sp. D3_18a_C4]|uniref:hypothetical protein n=1 Tax=unclassified Microcoleus TaxID=2642155 RepID=UPI002FD10B28
MGSRPWGNVELCDLDFIIPIQLETISDAQKPGFLAHRNENRDRKSSGRSSVGVAI